MGMYREAGFTIIELIVVIVVIGILMTIGVASNANVLASSRDSQRIEDVTSITRLLESIYTNQSAGGPQYPTATDFVSAVQSHTGYTTTTDASIFTAPGDTASSVMAAGSSTPPASSGSGLPATDQYIYQPLTSDNKYCKNSPQICVRYKLYYVLETTHSLVTIDSGHQQ
jgi:prepilin-type N-terminal cleavage/methylation domain-containing protein